MVESTLDSDAALFVATLVTPSLWKASALDAEKVFLKASALDSLLEEERPNDVIVVAVIMWSSLATRYRVAIWKFGSTFDPMDFKH
jgi:hypothetical protein